MEFIKPVKTAGDKEVSNFVALVVEDKGSPVGMLASSRIRMLIQAGAVKAA